MRSVKQRKERKERKRKQKSRAQEEGEKEIGQGLTRNAQVAEFEGFCIMEMV